MPGPLPVSDNDPSGLLAILRIIRQRVDSAVAQARTQLQAAEREAALVAAEQAELEEDAPRGAVLNANLSEQMAAAQARQAALRLQLQNVELEAQNLCETIDAFTRGDSSRVQAFLNAYVTSAAEESEEEDSDQAVATQKRPRNY